MAKKEKVVDLKPKAESLSKEELQDLQVLVRAIDKMHYDIGRVEAQKHNILHQLAGKNDEVRLLQAKLEEKYGKADIDVRDGSIKYPEDGQANS